LCVCVNIRNINSQCDAYNHLLFKIYKKLQTHAENIDEKLLAILKLIELAFS